MKSDLRNVKVGDTILVKAEVIEINKKSNFPILTNMGLTYNLDGKLYKEAQFPSAFLEFPFVEVKEYLVTKKNTTGTEVKKGVVIDDIFYEKSECKVWKEIERVTLEIPLSELENNPDLKKYLKQ